MLSLQATATPRNCASSSSCSLWTSQRRSYRICILQRPAFSLWVPCALSCPPDKFEISQNLLPSWLQRFLGLRYCIHLKRVIKGLVERGEKLAKNWCRSIFVVGIQESLSYPIWVSASAMRPIPGVPSRRLARTQNSSSSRVYFCVLLLTFWPDSENDVFYIVRGSSWENTETPDAPPEHQSVKIKFCMKKLKMKNRRTVRYVHSQVVEIWNMKYEI